MKKLIYASFILLLLAASFLVGSWYNQRNAVKTIPSGLKTAAVNAAEKPDTAADTSSLPPGTVKVSPEKEQLISLDCVQPPG